MSATLLTPTTRVNLRAGPGTQHQILAAVSPGAPLAEVSRAGGWIQVEFGSTLYWVSAAYVTPITPAAPAPSLARPETA